MVKSKLAARDQITSTIESRNNPATVLNLTQEERNQNLIKALAHINDPDLDNEVEVEQIE